MEDFIHDRLEDSGVLVFEVFAPKFDGCACVFDTVVAHVGVLLDFFSEYDPGQETKREFPSAARAERE